jgi:sulfonate transport system substrate-binding protein
MNSRAGPRQILFFLGPFLAAGCLMALAAGCHSGTDNSAPAGPNKVRVAYLGLTCEAAMFVAYEKGFFKDEGLDVELVKTDWDGLRDGLGLGRFDANYTLIMYLLKPIEQGLDVKITGGVHSGCLRVQAGVKSSIKSVEDLKGKRIGVPTNLGSPPFLFASRVLAAHGMNPRKDVEWVVLPPEVLGLAIDNGQVDAVANSEPIGSILTAQGKVRTVADQAVDPPYSEEYCCAVVVSGALAKRSPAAAAKVTRAMLKGASWVEENPTAAAMLSVEKRYISASSDVNAHAISKLKYAPGIARCRTSLDLAAAEMKTAGLLKSSTDPAELAKRAWLDLDGVTDEWIKGLQVERIAGGGRPAHLDDRAFVALLAGQPVSCCDGK